VASRPIGLGGSDMPGCALEFLDQASRCIGREQPNTVDSFADPSLVVGDSVSGISS
jgi:hypothetical protein